MLMVNMLEAKSSLSRLVEAVEQGTEPAVIIARHGRPVAKLVALDKSLVGNRIGAAKGKFVVPDDIDQSNDEIVSLFAGGVAL